MSLIRERRTPPESLGPMLRAARERAGLGVREAARRTGLSSGYMANLEAGGRCPSRTVAERLAAVLELDDDEQAQLYGAAVTDAGRDHPARTAA
ncbi:MULTISPECIES: helix-turn-helix transcriptional regulator [unclassified Streptomyces]|uniref:helix-turn-helix domain-containing protein n=1 Tax=unclassified Streptomyces TaxID=2593676 RepID=UPI00116226E4|nr:MULTISPECIES: helix-turn-helix transcriptional regulator [unclassified Streptomyces]NMI57105.1 helix-turn-helix transcriptional regulator [Streptomyces sp. RLA2-12]QDN56485.1 helix-turn-helix transcriptional regulator [Streptomyces sp. S1D4-20]QDN66662.1 helix-turn-helix transcriptional regulator [Streptomyces sp. S1D4-14]QDO49069.1 helix-turn-helix transcriptional regulator [Streptomyces sp. RLB3-5]QDO59310.1 helix-turn-helix transcriptional regulator [Streptomyces sp. RLB1-8]